ncbi:MAG: hypothetical protein EZS28_051502, partial [Streblomastix strix]
DFKGKKEKRSIDFSGINKNYGQNAGTGDFEISYIPEGETIQNEVIEQPPQVETEQQAPVEEEDLIARKKRKTKNEQQLFEKDGFEQQEEQSQAVEEEPVQQQEQEQEQIPNNDECPKGIVEVTVFGVKNVAAMDSNGKSDPFIKVIVGGNEQKTQKKKNTLNAEFNETFKFDFDPSTTDQRDIKLELWDYDTIGDNDQIGNASFPV